MKSRKYGVWMMLAVFGLLMMLGTGCASKNSGGYKFSLRGSAAQHASADMKWRHKYLLEQAHACMNSKVSGLKFPSGSHVLQLDNPVGWSRGRPELYRQGGAVIYGEAWRQGGTYYVRLPHAGNGYADTSIHKHEAGHTVEFRNGIAAHDPRFESCFHGTHWIRRSARSVINLGPGPDRPLDPPHDLPEVDERVIVRIDEDGELYEVVQLYFKLTEGE